MALSATPKGIKCHRETASAPPSLSTSQVNSSAEATGSRLISLVSKPGDLCRETKANAWAYEATLSKALYSLPRAIVGEIFFLDQRPDHAGATGRHRESRLPQIL